MYLKRKKHFTHLNSPRTSQNECKYFLKFMCEIGEVFSRQLRLNNANSTKLGKLYPVGTIQNQQNTFVKFHLPTFGDSYFRLKSLSLLTLRVIGLTVMIHSSQFLISRRTENFVHFHCQQSENSGRKCSQKSNLRLL